VLTNVFLSQIKVRESMSLLLFGTSSACHLTLSLQNSLQLSETCFYHNFLRWRTTDIQGRFLQLPVISRQSVQNISKNPAAEYDTIEQRILDTNAGKQLSWAATDVKSILVLKNEQHLNVDLNFDHQMYLSKSKYWYSNNYLHFLKCIVPLWVFEGGESLSPIYFYLSWLCSHLGNTMISSWRRAYKS